MTFEEQPWASRRFPVPETPRSADVDTMTPRTKSSVHETRSKHDPALLAVLAAHMKRCMEIIRDAGLRGDGQISRKLLRQTVEKLGLHAKARDVDDLFEYLDPEATGCIDFSDMSQALREARKALWAPRNTPHRPPSPCVLPSRHANGAPINEEDYEQMSHAYQQEGKLGAALKAIDKAASLHRKATGERGFDDKMLQLLAHSADLCNMMAMSLLQEDDFTACLKLLKKAEATCLMTRNKPLLAITLNNIACYYRRRSQPKVAIAYLMRALDIETKCKSPHKPADTHLNLCAVSSQLGHHHQAMRHAKAALHLLKRELGGDAQPGSASGLLTEGQDLRGSPERMAVLAIAYHNLAVQQERMELQAEALRSFAHAADIASRHVGDAHPITSELRSAYEAASEEMIRSAVPPRDGRRRADEQHACSPTSPRDKEAYKRVRQQQNEAVQRHVHNLKSGREHDKAKPFVPHTPREPHPLVTRDSLNSGGAQVKLLLRQYLEENASRVMSSFRRWDAEGRGYVDQAGFQHVVRVLGVKAPPEVVDEVFDSLDHGQRGIIELDDLSGALRAPSLEKASSSFRGGSSSARGTPSSAGADATCRKCIPARPASARPKVRARSGGAILQREMGASTSATPRTPCHSQPAEAQNAPGLAAAEADAPSMEAAGPDEILQEVDRLLAEASLR
ncbi:hypothetical protein AB1Y20_008490 [Prymnesium parvum]|uniref:EF-hand domain-containing protein n=1 Tax=Prymnesium parvum TaxID=97485 RepID=A0AB34IQN3_PRYPA